MSQQETYQWRMVALITVLFIIMLIFDPIWFFLVDFVFIILLVLSLKTFEGKHALLLFSPIIVYPVTALSILMLSSFVPYLGIFALTLTPIIIGVLYAYLFRNILTDMLAPALRMRVYGIMCGLFVVCSIIAVLGTRCAAINGDGKGATRNEIQQCSALNMYNPNPNFNSKSGNLAVPFSLAFLLPSGIILLGMGGWYVRKKAK